jgi:tetratricopeptide (TPR) repeat protein
VLLSLFVLLKGLDKQSYLYLLLSSILLLLGCISKEVAVFFLPGACLITLWHQRQASNQTMPRSSGERLRQLSVLITPFFIGGSTYVLLRLFSHRSNPKGILQVFEGSPYDLFNTIRVIFKVFGFYVKKLFLPLPLNFAIVKFDNNYVWLGIIIFLLLIVIALRKTINSALFMTIFFLIVPAFLVSLSKIAWTPVAERYLYLPSAFFVIGIVGISHTGLNLINRTSWLAPALVLILFPATFFTEQRITIWQDNLSLYQDTHNKSPEFLLLRNELALALFNKGRTAEANLELETAKRLDPQKSNVLIYVNKAMYKMQEGKLLEARAILQETFTEKKSANAEVLKLLAKVDESRIFNLTNRKERFEIYREIMDTNDHLYRKTANPMSLYRAGQMALFLGENKRAGEYFAKAYQVSPDGTFFKPAAKKLAEKYNK